MSAISEKMLHTTEQAEETEKRHSDRRMKVAIIGTGWIAESHIESYKAQDDVDVVAMADLIPGKAEKFAKKFGVENCRFYPDHKALLAAEKDLDAVSVCTYNATHAEVTIDCLNAGVNVLLEKPFTVTLDEAVEVMKAEKKSGKILSIGFQPRMDENMKEIKKIIDSGVLGKIYYVQTGGGRRRGMPNSTFIEKKTGGVGAVGDIGCYSLDLVMHALGDPKPLTVSGYTSNFFGTNPEYQHASQGFTAEENAARFNVDDFAAAFIRLEGGTILDFRIAWAMHLDTPGDTIFMGTKGSLRVPSTECWNGTFDKPMTIYTDVAGEQVQFDIPLKAPSKLFDKKIRSFLDAIIDGTSAPVPSSQIIYNEAIIDGIVRSGEVGHEVSIEIPEI